MGTILAIISSLIFLDKTDNVFPNLILQPIFIMLSINQWSIILVVFILYLTINITGVHKW
jgi:hypothetical protein